MEEEENDLRIEKEIEEELSRISVSSSETDDPDTELSAESSSDSEPISDELPESVHRYLNFVRSRSQNAERLELQNLENDKLSDIPCVVPNSASDCLAKLASEYNEDPEEFKKRVLSEIENEELEASAAPDSAVDSKVDDDLSANEADDVYDGDPVVSFSFREVEKRCKQEYKLWVEKQKEGEHEKIKMLKAKREIEETRNHEENKRRQLRQEELDAERMKIELFHAQQQALLEEEVLKEEEAWEEQLRQHKELIKTLHVQIEEEKQAFEEQQAKERQRLAEQQNMAAVKIQAQFRAFVIHKEYAPVLREWRAELKRKREMQEAVEREQKEKEERRKRRALELKQQQERERKGQEEKERQELAEKVKRQEEYERKKEKVRLLREEQRMLEELERAEKSKLNLNLEPENMGQEIKLAKEEQETEKGEEEGEVTKSPQNKMESENTDKDIANKGTEIEKMEHEKGKTGNTQRTRSENKDDCSAMARKEEVIKDGVIKEVIKEQEAGSATVKSKQIMGKELKEQSQHVKYEEEKQERRHGMIREKLRCEDGAHEDGKRESAKEEHLNMKHSEASVEHEEPYAEDHCSTTGDFQKTRDTEVLSSDMTSVLDQENSIYNDHNNLNVHLDSGDAGRTEKTHVLKHIKFAAKEIHEEMSGCFVKDDNAVQCFEHPPVLSDSLEEKRLTWIKTCKSWSRIWRENQRKKVVEKSRPRKCSAGMMPPLSAATIIQAGPWNALEQVTAVTFHDLPGCSLSTLSQCSMLQFLSLRRCGLLALEGLSNCKDLKYIDVEENNIQVINCENLENLCILILNKNNISSLHGLYGCCNLWNLELSYNKITRIGGLESLKNLQRLVVDHNQLISTKGLSDTPTLVCIDCSFNRLTCVEGIDSCGLLQILKLQGNSLNELPSLDNHVLLRELYLEDNSISSLDKFSTYWLPLLRILILSENSLTQLAPLFSFVSLEKLDLSNNCLSELQSVIPWLNGCHHLTELSLHGNPLLQEENWRCSLVRLLPSLKILNDENIRGDAEIPAERIRKKPEPGSYAVFCQAQIQEIDLVSKKATTGLGDEFSVDAAQLQMWYFKKLIKLSSEHRYAHEYGILSATKAEEPEQQTHHLNQEAFDNVQKNNVFITGAKENKQDLLHSPERWIASCRAPVNSFVVPAVQKNKEYKQNKKSNQYSFDHNEEGKDNNVLISPKKNTISKQIMTSNGGNCLQHFDSLQNLAATVIQSCWRGCRVRKKINFWTRLHLSATIIQSFWRMYRVRKKRIGCNKGGHNDMDKHKAATTIQAFWKGFRLRKKLASALAAVKTDEVEDDYHEVNVDDFMFDEAVIEKEWPALDSARFLSQTVLYSDQFPSPKYNEPARCEDKLHHLEWSPHKTWRLQERSKSFMSENGQISNRSGQSTLSWHSDVKNHPQSPRRSEKEEKISKEWGFKDLYTAQLMLKRAHKMKAKKPSSKKRDPAVRLAFKNNENKHPPMKPPKKAQAEKPSYFEDKEEEWTHMDRSAEKIEKSKERAYQWLHTQVWDYEGTSPRNEKCKHFLPEIDPEVLKGGRVQLVTSPVRREDTDLELVSMTSGSTLTQNKEKNHQPYRLSTGSSKKDAPVPERSHLGPSLKERISFRDHPVQLSGGWGSGKKKAKALK
ncbi:leucine-rich repeat and IQ domain-containing protein 1 [Tiliqua scincoides]|uniref:leucine-rich repeat and IQ domain-containing protein 1 n=1 Tax=Tiliqua scincoides TaxID=71010 RepID=UPI003462622B